MWKSERARSRLRRERRVSEKNDRRTSIKAARRYVRSRVGGKRHRERVRRLVQQLLQRPHVDRAKPCRGHGAGETRRKDRRAQPGALDRLSTVCLGWRSEEHT